jgi:uncharacterized glyoxalase superfamily protein PhnB
VNTRLPDPFDALRLDDEPLAPRQQFAAALREQLLAELGEPTMTTATSTTATSTTATSAPATTPGSAAPASVTVVPYLSVRNAAAALDFYRDAFGAVEGQRLVGADGRVGHAEIMIGSSRLMLADEYSEIDSLGPQSRGGPTCTFTINVADVDAAFERALGHGATVLREPADQFYGSRSAMIADPFGHRWNFNTVIAEMSDDDYAAAAAGGGYSVQRRAATTAAEDHQIKHYEPGDLYYFTIPVRDLARAQAFFGALLGWQFEDPQAGHVSSIAAPPGGVREVTEPADTQLWFVVDDVHAAVLKVRELGGSAEEPVDYDSGWAVDCRDDQGTRFSLSVPAAKYTR